MRDTQPALKLICRDRDLFGAFIRLTGSRDEMSVRSIRFMALENGFNVCSYRRHNRLNEIFFVTIVPLHV